MRRIILAGCVVFQSLTSNAQTTSADTTAVLTFEEAVKIGLMRSVTLNQQKNQLELSQMLKVSSIASMAPSLTLNGTASRFDGNSFDQQQGRAVNGVRDNVSVSLEAQANLFSGFRSLNTLKQYSSALDAQSYFVKRTAQDVINTVSLQYLRVLMDVELLRIARENFEVQDKQLQQIHEFVQAGSRAPVDELNQDALTKAAELTMVQAEITLNNDKALLTQTLQIDPFDEFQTEKPSWDINAIGDENLDPQVMLQTAKMNRADYHQAERLELSNKYSMRAARGALAPSIYAFGRYGSAYNYVYNIPDSILQQNEGINRSFTDQIRKDNTYLQYGVGIQIPLINGFQNRTSYVQQRVNYQNSTLVKNNMEILLKNDVQRGRRNFDGAKKAFAVSQAQLLAAEEAYKLETERYNLGVTSLIDYITANRSFIQAQTNFAQAEYQLLFQKIQLQYTLGTLKIEDFQ